MSEIHLVEARSDKPLEYSYDARLDVITIEGIKYSGALFRGLGIKTPVGAWVQVCSRTDGVLTLRQTSTPAKFCPECGGASLEGQAIWHEGGCLFTFSAAPIDGATDLRTEQP